MAWIIVETYKKSSILLVETLPLKCLKMMKRLTKVNLIWENFSVYWKNRSIINRKKILVKLWRLTIVDNIVNTIIIKVAIVPASQIKTLKTNTVKNAMHLFTILKLTNIKTFWKLLWITSLKGMRTILKGSKRCSKKSERNELMKQMRKKSLKIKWRIRKISQAEFLI